MTPEDLDEIEHAVGFQLPMSYRTVALEQPFRSARGDSVYWFFNQSARVIEETLCFQVDGDNGVVDWQPGYLAIGNSACGDLYILDTGSGSLAVHELSHETFEIEKSVWNSFGDFVYEWLRRPAEIEKAAEANLKSIRAEQWERIRRGLWVVAMIIGVCLLTPLLLSLFIKR